MREAQVDLRAWEPESLKALEVGSELWELRGSWTREGFGGEDWKTTWKWTASHRSCWRTGACVCVWRKEGSDPTKESSKVIFTSQNHSLSVDTRKRHVFIKYDFCWNSFRIFYQTTSLETKGSWNKKRRDDKSRASTAALMYSIKHVSFLIRHKGNNQKHDQRLNCPFAHLGKEQSESEWAALWRASVLCRNHMEVSHALLWAFERHEKKLKRRADEIWRLQGAIVIRSRLLVPLAALFRRASISLLLLVWNQLRVRPITQLYTTISWASFPVLSRLHLSLLLVQIFNHIFSSLSIHLFWKRSSVNSQI